MKEEKKKAIADQAPKTKPVSEPKKETKEEVNLNEDRGGLPEVDFKKFLGCGG